MEATDKNKYHSLEGTESIHTVQFLTCRRNFYQDYKSTLVRKKKKAQSSLTKRNTQFEKSQVFDHHEVTHKHSPSPS